METSFQVDKKDINKTKAFIRSLKTARFKSNPFEVSGTYYICVSFTDMAESTELSRFLSTLIDKEPVPKKSLWSWFVGCFK